MAKNYMPFARREEVTVPAGGRVATSITALSIGGGIRSYLGDMALEKNDTSTRPYLQARIGILGKGYLTEGFYPYQMFCNGTVNESGAWRFPRPYRLYPGQRMKAKFVFPDTNAVPNSQALYRPGIMFSGVRLKDGRPILLYDSNVDAEPAQNAAFLLAGDNLQCPADSPVDLYSVTGPVTYIPYAPGIVGVQLQIWGPDDRAWWDDPTWANITCPPSTLIDLDKPEWILDPKDTITVEFQSGEATNIDVVVTLRGSYEVE